MTTLVLVRHGQASFGARNYDELSPLGHRQSELLGAFWRNTGFAADSWFAGDMARQRSTGESALKALGLDCEIGRHAGFNEYDHEGLIRSFTPVIAAEHRDLALDARALGADRKLFQRFFEKVIHHWLDGREGAEPIKETWAEFCRRSLAGLEAIVRKEGGTAVAFTSGGVITAALAEAMKLDGRKAFELNWRVYNASVHVFRLGRRGLTPMGFNNISHLELARDPSLLTFR